MGWEQHDTEAYVRSVILDRSPDVVCFQELPGLVPFVETHSMIGSNPQTHSGNLATLVGNHLLDDEPTWLSVGNFALCVKLGSLTIANVHLASGSGADDERLTQTTQIVQAATSGGVKSPFPFIVVGDTNTRIGEESNFANLGLATERPPFPTWDSKTNRFNPGGQEFTAYFSRWFGSVGLTVTDAWVGNQPLVGYLNQRFFVSDHFAFGGTVQIGPGHP